MKRFEEAIIYATIMHQGKVRKINNRPFILHPIEVAQILGTMTDDEDIIAAGVLHDVVEGTDGTLDRLRGALATGLQTWSKPAPSRTKTWATAPKPGRSVRKTP